MYVIHTYQVRGTGKLIHLYMRISIAAPAGCECNVALNIGIGAVRLLLYCIILLYTAACVESNQAKPRDLVPA